MKAIQIEFRPEDYEEAKGLAKNVEMTKIEEGKRDLEGEEEAENTEIAI